MRPCSPSHARRPRARTGRGPGRALAALLGAVTLGAGLGAGLGACDRAPRVAADRTAPTRGAPLAAPLSRPHFTLVDAYGRPFAFYEATRGQVTLVMTGYIDCPDVCPVHLASLAGVLRARPDLRDRVRVVFVTADPARDTPARLRAWLGTFDETFVGLTGAPAAVAAARTALQLPAATGAGAPGHAAQVVAFAADDSARWVYPFGTRQVDWAADLPRLVAYTGG